MADRQSHTGAPRATSGWTHAQEHVRGSSLASRYWPPPPETRLGRPPLPGSEAGQKPDRRVFPRLRVSAPGPSPGIVCVSGHTVGCPRPLLSSARVTFPGLPGLQEAGALCPELPSGNLLFLCQALALPCPLVHFILCNIVQQTGGVASLSRAQQGRAARPRSHGELEVV